MKMGEDYGDMEVEESDLDDLDMLLHTEQPDEVIRAAMQNLCRRVKKLERLQHLLLHAVKNVEEV